MPAIFRWTPEAAGDFNGMATWGQVVPQTSLGWTHPPTRWTWVVHHQGMISHENRCCFCSPLVAETTISCYSSIGSIASENSVDSGILGPETHRTWKLNQAISSVVEKFWEHASYFSKKETRKLVVGGLGTGVFLFLHLKREILWSSNHQLTFWFFRGLAVKHTAMDPARFACRDFEVEIVGIPSWKNAGIFRDGKSNPMGSLPMGFGEGKCCRKPR